MFLAKIELNAKWGITRANDMNTIQNECNA